MDHILKTPSLKFSSSKEAHTREIEAAAAAVDNNEAAAAVAVVAVDVEAGDDGGCDEHRRTVADQDHRGSCFAATSSPFGPHVCD